MSASLEGLRVKHATFGVRLFLAAVGGNAAFWIGAAPSPHLCEEIGPGRGHLESAWWGNRWSWDLKSDSSNENAPPLLPAGRRRQI